MRDSTLSLVLTIEKSKKQSQSTGEQEAEDHFEHAKLPVPKSVLDNCEASFAAADEKRIKSSTQFFDDTGLMALNCRHDHALFVVNMKTAGEKQSHMYALLMTLFSHLPRSFVVGFLYDIACQAERSARKWGFLPPEYLERLQFAVSVLHAFGHHWVCQMKYHPRRREFFGLSDGEGCERFWHLISKLISYLRRREAMVNLKECGEEESTLRREYKNQLEVQTRPLPKRAKNTGKLAIEEVLCLRKAVAVLKARITNLEDVMIAEAADAADVAVANIDLETARAKLVNMEQNLRQKEGGLGVTEKQTLNHLVKSPYIRARMNARALKFRLREKLRNRKFELNRVERTYHRKKTDVKLKAHIEDAVKRGDPGIQEVLRQYNRLCNEMAKLISHKKAPKNAVALKPIDRDSIWGLDVNDEIWQDIGLDDAYDQTEPPLWLKGDKVRNGIRAMLEVDRCDEEKPRLFHECRALHYWLSEEWVAVKLAIAEATENEDPGLIHQLELRRHELCRLCATWRAAIRPIPFNADGLPEWGPSEEELMAVRIEDVVPRTRTHDDGYEEEEDELESEHDDDEELPIDEIEAFQRARVYADEGKENYFYASGDPEEDWGTVDDTDWFAQS
ncbi:hypothetical protein K438DRAFT_1989989 [Mycena galopus ATCC 62051]|nr:hypothetical protein K438DRAFT_1989989 [Mycena galopus ATCC 62051]